MNARDGWLILLIIIGIAAAAVLIAFPVYYLIHIAHAPNWGVALCIFTSGSLTASLAANR